VQYVGSALAVLCVILTILGTEGAGKYRLQWWAFMGVLTGTAFVLPVVFLWLASCFTCMVIAVKLHDRMPRRPVDLTDQTYKTDCVALVPVPDDPNVN
jgi:uncharacterized membrane protein